MPPPPAIFLEEATQRDGWDSCCSNINLNAERGKQLLAELCQGTRDLPGMGEVVPALAAALSHSQDPL